LRKKYGLDSKTQFNTRVERVYKDPHGHRIVNGPSLRRFDSVIAAVGTCVDAKMPTLTGQDYFKG
jgi:cation diffusion facilitator CzcD-associated flavoprotein CzcO